MPVLGKKKKKITCHSLETIRQDKVLKHGIIWHLVCTVPADTRSNEAREGQAEASGNVVAQAWGDGWDHWRNRAVGNRGVFGHGHGLPI
jgi:hypothetical protein